MAREFQIPHSRPEFVPQGTYRFHTLSPASLTEWLTPEKSTTNPARLSPSRPKPRPPFPDHQGMKRGATLSNSATISIC
jgi:hypothetical protein